MARVISCYANIAMINARGWTLVLLTATIAHRYGTRWTISTPTSNPDIYESMPYVSSHYLIAFLITG
jgi:hypothetical protein